jgi:hypothetical protein
MVDKVEETEDKEALIKKMIEKYNELGTEKLLITALMNQESKTGRNNRCHCGSGKKYKNCCLSLYEEKVSRVVELQNSIKDIACEIKETRKEIKEKTNKESWDK